MSIVSLLSWIGWEARMRILQRRLTKVWSREVIARIRTNSAFNKLIFRIFVRTTWIRTILIVMALIFMFALVCSELMAWLGNRG